MLIQCKKELFVEIMQIMEPYEPEIREEKGTGYINVFDKDWIFIVLSRIKHPKRYDKIIKHIQNTTEPYLMGIDKPPVIILQQGIQESDKYIFCRKVENEIKLLHGCTSYIIFKGVERK